MHTLGITDVKECVIGEEVLIEDLIAILLVHISALADSILVFHASSKLFKTKAIVCLFVGCYK